MATVDIDQNDSGIVDSGSYASNTSVQTRDDRCSQMYQDTSGTPEIGSPDPFEVDNHDLDNSFFDKSVKHHKFDKSMLFSMEQTLKGILPPPSVTSIDLCVEDLLKKYYSNQDIFNTLKTAESSKNSENVKWQSVNQDLIERTDQFKWPHVLRNVYHDVHYNVTSCSEKVELLAMRCAERCISGETESTITVFTNKIQERKQAAYFKLSQAKSPGRRLSHLAKRRITFNSFSSLSGSSLKMVQLDKNYFPHRKLNYHPGIRKSPRLNKNKDKSSTPTTTKANKDSKSSTKKTPKSKNTPNRKSAVRRLLIDPDKPNINKSRRSLFTSPTEKLNLNNDQEPLAKRKRDLEEAFIGNRNKIARSLSFACDNSSFVGTSSQSIKLVKSATETFPSGKSTVKLNELHKKKLLWAVSEGLRGYGVKMGDEKFREHATSLARLLKKLIGLPEYSVQMARCSTSETMLKLARRFAYPIISGKSCDECFNEELEKAKCSTSRINGYISITEYRKMQQKFPSSTKENSTAVRRSSEKKSEGVLQDRTLQCNSENNKAQSNVNEKRSLGRSFTAPTFQEAAKLKARRQISFDFG